MLAKENDSKKYGSSESEAHVWSETGYLICLRHLLTSTAFGHICRYFYKKITATLGQPLLELPSNISAMTEKIEKREAL